MMKHDEHVDQRIDPHRIAREIEDIGKKWADAAHAAKLLESTSASVLATLTLQMREGLGSNGKPVSVAEAKLQAQASEDWLTHIYATVEARRAANLARVMFDAVTAKFEASRTAEATRRAELVALGKQ